MKIFRLAAAASIAVGLTVLSAGTAQAYPDSPNVTIAIPSSVIVGGTSFTFSAKADVECDWTVDYAEGRAAGVPAKQSGSGTSISGSYETKKVAKTFKSPITVTCAYDANEAGSADSAAKSATASASATVTLLPLGASSGGGSDSGNRDDNGVLPDTGGSSFWILVVGGVLVVAGGGAVVASRRRHAAR